MLIKKFKTIDWYGQFSDLNLHENFLRIEKEKKSIVKNNAKSKINCKKTLVQE